MIAADALGHRRAVRRHPEGRSRRQAVRDPAAARLHAHAGPAGEAYDQGYFYPGPAVKDVTLQMAPRRARTRSSSTAARSTTADRAVPQGDLAARRSSRSPRSTSGTSRSAAAKVGRSRTFEQLRLDGVTRRFGDRERAARPRPDHRARRVHRPARPVRLRQVDRAELPGRPAAADRGQHLARRHAGSTRCRRSSAGSAWCSRTTRCSRTCPCAPTSPSACKMRGVGQRRGPAPRRRGAPAGPAHRARGEAPRPAVRRPAAARRDRPRRRARAAAGADGRAAVQPGRQAAPGDAHARSAASTRRSA